MSVWHQLTVEGSAAAARAFVTGFVAGRGAGAPHLFAGDLGLESGGFPGGVRDLLHPGARHALFAPADLATALAAAIRDQGAAAGVRLAGAAVVDEVAFAVAGEAFSRETANAIRERFLDSPPAGTDLTGVREEDLDEPGGEGVELYTPLHAYTYRLTGSVRGDLPAVAEMRRRAEALEWLTAGPLLLSTRPLPTGDASTD